MSSTSAVDRTTPHVAAASSPARGPLPFSWADVLVVLVLAFVAAGSSLARSSGLLESVLSRDAQDVWFEADTERVVDSMTSRFSDHYRSAVHPLFTLISYPPTFAVRRGLGVEAATAATMVTASVAATWIIVIFAVLRLVGCRRLDATLFSLLALVSASAIFWFSVPETYSFGSVSILLAMLISAVAAYRPISSFWYVLVSALTLSFTTTNWMAGIAAAIGGKGWRRALQISANAFCIVVLAWGAQKFVFPTVQFFIGPLDEARYVMTDEAAGPMGVSRAFLFHSMVMPAINIVSPPERTWDILSVQGSLPGVGSFVSLAAVGLWTALLALGCWGFVVSRGYTTFKVVLMLTLVGQLALHLVYGEETFLYSLHFLPLLIFLAAFSARTRFRSVALIVTTALVVAAGTNNLRAFGQAESLLMTGLGAARATVRTQMQARPDDPWPRGEGHVVLGAPGSLEADKAYHEPGGSFSPSVGSFGVSIWTIGDDGALLETSDSVARDALVQRLIWKEGRPGVTSSTRAYTAAWTMEGPGHWQLGLSQASAAPSLEVVVRSVGPAGGPITALRREGSRVLINGRWAFDVSPAPAAVVLGDETTGGWTRQPSEVAEWQGENGWGFARIVLAGSGPWQMTLRDSTPPAMPELATAGPAFPLQLDLPDERFVASLEAQVAHLLMGLVGRETRPGDPTHYPLPWQRDGAYVVAALAAAGRLEQARLLTGQLAEVDFFGGFGPEADAPGLGLWALDEVATRLADPAFDRSLWPHVQRKAGLILEMLSTSVPIHKPLAGPVVARMLRDPELTLVADPARDGLIVGKMDHHRPLLFVNAVSYLGLVRAARLADRLGEGDDAVRWRTEAARIQQAWGRMLARPEGRNERTYISGLWPSWVAAPSADLFLEQLIERWGELRDPQGNFHQRPLWTYFDIAEAHQFLVLDEPDRVWRTLSWFWDQQVSPGLYTWWEGQGEDNGARLWSNVRGWVEPPHITPHYWTAAELLLLQLAMLAYVDERGDEPVLVVGAGVPARWLEQPIGVEGIQVANGRVDWRWDGSRLVVTLHGPPIGVRLGTAFPPGTAVLIDVRPSGTSD